MRALCALVLAAGVVNAADRPDVDALKKQLAAAEAKVKELKKQLAAADDPKTLPNGRVLAFHTDGKGGISRARAGDWDSFVDITRPSVPQTGEASVSMLVQVHRWDGEPVDRQKCRAVEGVTVVTDTGKELKVEAKDPKDIASRYSFGRDYFRESIHVVVPPGTRYIDVDIPNTMVGGKGEVFKWRVLAEKWQPLPKKRR